MQRPWSRIAFALAPFIFILGLSLVPRHAHAQYKNSSFGLDVGGWLITKPSLLDGNGVIKPVNNRPNRLANGIRIGGEVSTKMSEDHWWFSGRVNVGILSYNSAENGSQTALFDSAAQQQLGTILGFQGQVGFRYYILTDRIRPYLGMSFSYMRLFSFTSASSDQCFAGQNGIYGSVCLGGQSYRDEFLPHPNLLGFHLEPGVEFIIQRDIALRLSADLQKMIVFNAEDNYAVVIVGGVVFYL